MKTKLTDRLLRSIQPPASGRVVLTDTTTPGLRFRVTSNGSRTFLFEKQIKGGKRRAFTLGAFPQTSLSDARAAAMSLDLKARAGIDPVEQAEAEEAMLRFENDVSKTVGFVLDLYATHHLGRALNQGPASREREKQLRTYLAPYLDKKIRDLTRGDLQGIVDAKAAEGKLTMANRLRAALRAFSSWAEDRDYLDVDPGLKVRAASKERVRTRTPSLGEIHEIWDASYKCGELWGPFFRLVVLLGQRSRTETLALNWAWVNFEKKQIEIPETKNGKPHIVPLSSPALKELESRRKSKIKSDQRTTFVFSTTDSTAASGVSKAKKRLDGIINETRESRGMAPMPHWVLHDLRRSQATALAEAGVSEGVVDRIQNHQATGSRPSQVAEVYNRAEMLEQRREALNLWADLVTGRRPADGLQVSI